MPRRARYFRGVIVRLECGHERMLSTSRYRVSRDLAACIVGDAIRKGVWCHPCGGHCAVTEYVGIGRESLAHAARA